MAVKNLRHTSTKVEEVVSTPANQKSSIDESLACRLVATQFPQWKNLSIQSVEDQGWDNRTFRLGDQMLVRLPSAERYAQQVEKEHCWLPRLALLLPLQIPKPLAMGDPTDEYPL